jgi:hypothetical protein
MAFPMAPDRGWKDYADKEKESRVSMARLLIRGGFNGEVFIV